MPARRIGLHRYQCSNPAYFNSARHFSTTADGSRRSKGFLSALDFPRSFNYKSPRATARNYPRDDFKDLNLNHPAPIPGARQDSWAAQIKNQFGPFLKIEHCDRPEGKGAEVE